MFPRVNLGRSWALSKELSPSHNCWPWHQYRWMKRSQTQHWGLSLLLDRYQFWVEQSPSQFLFWNNLYPLVEGNIADSLSGIHPVLVHARLSRKNISIQSKDTRPVTRLEDSHPPPHRLYGKLKPRDLDSQIFLRFRWFLIFKIFFWSSHWLLEIERISTYCLKTKTREITANKQGAGNFEWLSRDWKLVFRLIG